MQSTHCLFKNCFKNVGINVDSNQIRFRCWGSLGEKIMGVYKGLLSKKVISKKYKFINVYSSQQSHWIRFTAI